MSSTLSQPVPDVTILTGSESDWGTLPHGFDPSYAEAVERLVVQYCRIERPEGAAPFRVHPLCLWKKHVGMGGWWGSGSANLPGCYIVYDAKGAPLYLGKASHTKRIGDRLHTHERYSKAEWTLHGAMVQIVNVEHAYQAPSLEEYLLMHVPLIHNKHGSRARNALIAQEAVQGLTGGKV